jgi:hypothetical protein
MMTETLIPLLGEALLALIAIAATALPGWALLLWRKAIAYRVVQDGLLFAARQAVAMLRDQAEAGITHPEQAIDAAATLAQARVPGALKTLGLTSLAAVRDRVAARVQDLLWNR